jgi:hypothetical protein
MGVRLTSCSTRALLGLALLALVPCVPACKRDTTQAPTGEDALDQQTRDILLALRQHDDARLAELAAADLLDALDERARTQLSTTLDWLGSVESLSRVEEHALSEGVERRYALAFEHGEVELLVTSVGGRIAGLEFDAQTWPQLVERAVAAAAGQLRVAEFALTAADGSPQTAKLDPKAIHYAVALEGLAANLREHEVVVHKEVFDRSGALVYKEQQGQQLRFPAAEAGSSGARITGSFAVPGKGEFRLELRITDRVAEVTVVHVHEFAIE